MLRKKKPAFIIAFDATTQAMATEIDKVECL